MDDYKRKLVQRYENRICADVSDPEDIIIHLLSKNIIHPNDQDAISNSTPKLIKHILHAKTDGRWFEEFLIALSQEYKWISEDIRHDFDEQNEQKMTYYLSGRGSVPPLPHHNVTRTSYVQQLRKEIRGLKRDTYLVVHGMSGLGKTCLVVDALHDINLLEESLAGYVYWMSVGDLKNDELDDLQCLQLQKKLCDMIDLPINHQQDLLLQLKKHFSLPPNSEALIVLDKVRSSKVVDVLNVGCKVLVTTHDRDVVKHRKNFFPIDRGFSESESIQLLTEFVCNEHGPLLPAIQDCSAKVHQAWKGHPMAIGLIGGELAETNHESQRTPYRWEDYIRSAGRGDYDIVERRRSIVDEQMCSIIELATKKLPHDLKTCFHMLAVLVEDTNITSEVLKVLWGLDKQKVEKTMDLFYRRSLVFRKFNDHLQMPVYGIHDIIMEYLKKDISSSDRQEMHGDLITKFSAACDGNFANLPQDSYIYSYLCHHIECGKKWNEYREQFFSLRYIESKLKATGPGDILLDLHRYREGLTGESSEYDAKVKDIKNLVIPSGWDIHQKEVDIVQCALLQPKDSFLHEQATSIARKGDPSRVYFYPNNLWERPKDLESKVPNIRAVCLVNNSFNHVDGRVLIYPHQDNQIVELDMHYRQSRRSFKESSPVVMLKMSPLYDKFLAALESGSISVWNLTSGTFNAETPPPRLRQRSHQPFFEETRTTPLLSFKHKRSVTCACFSNDGKLIVSASEDGEVSVWNLEEHKCVFETHVHPSPSAIACTFLCDDTMIVYGVKDFKICFHQLSSNANLALEINRNNGDLVSLLGTRDELKKLIVVQENTVLLYTWELENLKHKRQGPRDLELVCLKIRVLHKEETKITCAAYHSKHRLLLGTENGCWLYFDILIDNCTPIRFGSGVVKTVDVIDSRVVFSQKDSVKMCWPDPGSKLLSEKQTVGGHLGWTTRNVSVYTSITSDGNIQVYHEGKKIGDKFSREACIVRVCPQGDNIWIGTTDGRISVFNTVSKTTDSLPFKFSSTISYLNVSMYNLKPVCLAASKTMSEVESYNLEAIGFDQRSYIKNTIIYAPVVKSFIITNKHCLIAVLCDYSILVWDLSQPSTVSCIQEGRVTAKITDAFLSKDENLLVLSDTEACFHQVSLDWPQDENNVQTRNENVNLIRPQFRNLSLAVGRSQGIDEVDGMRISPTPKMPVTGLMTTESLSGSSWCCCICPKGELIAIGYHDCKVLVYDSKLKRNILKFDVFPSRHTKVGQLQFSPYNVKLGPNTYRLTLLVITDVLSVFDLSDIITDNSGYRSSAVDARCLGCVSAGGNPITELSTNESFDKFSAFDEFGSYFSWNLQP